MSSSEHEMKDMEAASELKVGNPYTERAVENQGLIMDNRILRPSADLLFRKISIEGPRGKILHEISGTVKSGEILALMGPSGSGKTSLLNFLSHRHELIGLGPSHLSGEVYINNVLISKRDRRKIGYVMQQDLFFETLSLRETVTFYALVRLPKSMAKKDKIKKVMDLVEFLGLTNQLETAIGGGMIRGLSGGEKKRASIITEMITDPEILFLDEPTSGLDSNMAMNLVSTLKMMSEKAQKTIIASIHQPNSQIFFSFSKLLLLSQGKLAYYGPLQGVVTFFDDIGYPCPKNWNAADHIIDMARSDQKTIDNIVEKFKERYDFFDEVRHDQNLDQSANVGHKGHKHKKEKKQESSSYMTQLTALTRRSFMRSIKETWTFINLFKYLFMSLIVGIVWFQLKKTDLNISSIFGLLFFGTVNNFIDPFFTNIFQFAPEAIVIRRERMSSMYRLSAYYIGKVISDAAVLVARPTLVWTIIYWATGLYTHVIFLASLLHMILMAFMGQALGFIVSSFGLSFQETMMITGLYFIAIMLLGGFYNSDLPIWLSWVKYFSPIHYGYSIQLYFQLYANNGLDCDHSNSDSTFIGSPFPECNQGLDKVGIDTVMRFAGAEIHFGYYLLLSFAVLFLSHIGAFFSLTQTFKRPPSRKTVEERIVQAKCWKKFSKKNKKEKK